MPVIDSLEERHLKVKTEDKQTHILTYTYMYNTCIIINLLTENIHQLIMIRYSINEWSEIVIINIYTCIHVCM